MDILVRALVQAASGSEADLLGDKRDEWYAWILLLGRGLFHRRSCLVLAPRQGQAVLRYGGAWVEMQAGLTDSGDALARR